MLCLQALQRNMAMLDYYGNVICQYVPNIAHFFRLVSVLSLFSLLLFYLLPVIIYILKA